jgi:hypothetical protein
MDVSFGKWRLRHPIPRRIDSPVTKTDGGVAQGSGRSVAQAVRMTKALRSGIARDSRAQRDTNAGSRGSACRDRAEQVPT